LKNRLGLTDLWLRRQLEFLSDELVDCETEER